ncbi:ABC transporter ATP-binding protein [Vampirovibrio chlorellavorus]|uniref:ABC transporter ATP-binding protein n=1 Tax=Vampirovibrio chlorellavorus TaxID=758823 RepID=UPI0026F2102F|nr:ABC transporter ATP-binding protein [Vampirovibrio chlorellavorus]
MSMDVLAVPVKASERRESGLKDLMLLGKLWPYMRVYKKSLLISLLLLPIISLVEMGQTFIIRFAIDGPIRAGQLSQLFVYAGGFGLLLLINYGVRYLQMAESQNTGQKIIRDLRTDLYRHYQTLSPRFYHKHPLGKLVTRLTSDIENLSEMLSSGGLAILADLAMIVGALAGMLVMDWQLALVTVFTMLVLLSLMEFFRTRARHAYDDIRVKAARINAFLQENFAGMELVQLYRREAKNYSHFEALNRSNLQSGLDSIFYSTAFNAVVEFMTLITLVLVLWLGGLQVHSGTLTIGALVGFFLFVRKMFEPVEDVSEKYSILQSGLASIDKVMALFQEQPDLQHRQLAQEAAIDPVPKATGAIDLEQVSFGYNPQHRILKDISLHIRPGEKIAIVGPSGAGKTTLIKLLLRFYDVTSGSLKLDGRDVRDWNLHALRRNIVSIQQDDFLFSRRVSENIALEPYQPDLLPALRQAAEKSKALSVIERLPQGFETVLEERGKNLSAGEKQLLLFARAVYHDPAILVLDEATSAIDPVTEELVQTAMDQVMADRTVLVVAHRLSTIQQADRILVMEQGRIVQQGTHLELLQHAGLYRQFYEYQELLTHT